MAQKTKADLLREVEMLRDVVRNVYESLDDARHTDELKRIIDESGIEGIPQQYTIYIKVTGPFSESPSLKDAEVWLKDLLDNADPPCSWSGGMREFPDAWVVESIDREW